MAATRGWTRFLAKSSTESRKRLSSSESWVSAGWVTGDGDADDKGHLGEGDRDAGGRFMGETRPSVNGDGRALFA